MPRRIAFLHTSPVHVETFERLVRAADPTARVQHVVAEALLAQAQREGADDAALAARVHAAMADAAQAGAELVVCTCSTLGGAAERTPTAGRFSVARIDRAMADRAVLFGPRVLVVVALESTLQPTTRLLQESAAALGRPVEIVPLFVEAAWPLFQAGDTAGYVRTVAEAVRGACADAGTKAGVVVLAQASMAPAAATLPDLGIEVLASPALGVQAALAQLAP